MLSTVTTKRNKQKTQTKMIPSPCFVSGTWPLTLLGFPHCQIQRASPWHLFDQHMSRQTFLYLLIFKKTGEFPMEWALKHWSKHLLWSLLLIHLSHFKNSSPQNWPWRWCHLLWGLSYTRQRMTQLKIQRGPTEDWKTVQHVPWRQQWLKLKQQTIKININYLKVTEKTGIN